MENHDTGLLATLVVSLVFAWIAGSAARLVRLPPLVGYVLAGVAVGPFTPGFVADQKIAAELAEVGVALLLFGVGLHFSISDLWAVRRIAVPGALLQIAFATALGAAVAHFIAGLPLQGAVIVGLALSIASTAIATRTLEDSGHLDDAPGRIALGWLVVQDIVVILALVLVPALGAGGSTLAELPTMLGRVVLQLLGFVAVVVLIGRHAIPFVLRHAARSGSRELYTLTVIVLALGIAYGSASLFGVSLALGAFFAGVVLADSDLSHSASAEVLPVQQVFTILFFVSVGMLFDPATLLKMPFEILAILLAIVVGTGLSTLVLIVLLGGAPKTAAIVGAAFTQIGEFSFILATLAIGAGLLDAAGRDLILPAALIAVVLNPLALPLFRRIADRLPQRVERDRAVSRGGAPEGLVGHAIVVGHGRVGRTVAQALRQNGLRFVVVESNRRLVESLRAEGIDVIYGNASRPEVLAAALPRQARLIVIALPDAFHARQVLETARGLNPSIETVVRTHSDREADYLSDSGVGLAVMGEREIAIGISRFALERFGVDEHAVGHTVERLRTRAP